MRITRFEVRVLGNMCICIVVPSMSQQATVLAATHRSAAWANEVGLRLHAASHAKLGYVLTWKDAAEDATREDATLERVDLYEDTPIGLSANQSEQRGLVNGQLARLVAGRRLRWRFKGATRSPGCFA